MGVYDTFRLPGGARGEENQRVIVEPEADSHLCPLEISSVVHRPYCLDLGARSGPRHGFRYFHFPQPNQYVAGSKVLSREERMAAIATDLYRYRTAVESNYSAFNREGSQLQDLENFTDFTAMFARETRTVYADRHVLSLR